MPLPIVPAPTTPTCLICICRDSADLERTKKCSRVERLRVLVNEEQHARHPERYSRQIPGAHAAAARNTVDPKKLRDRVNIGVANLLRFLDTAFPNFRRGIT